MYGKDVSKMYEEVITKHGKAQEALTKLETTKELKETALSEALTKYKEEYGEDLKVEDLPEKTKALEEEVTALEVSLSKECEEFLEKWDNGGENVT